MGKHNGGGKNYKSSASAYIQAARDKEKRDKEREKRDNVVTHLSKCLGIPKASLIKSSPKSSPTRPDKPGEKAIVKLQSCVRGKSTRTKKVKILAPLAKATLKSTLGIRASRNIKDYLAGKKRKSRTSKKGKKRQ